MGKKQNILNTSNSFAKSEFNNLPCQSYFIKTFASVIKINTDRRSEPMGNFLKGW